MFQSSRSGRIALLVGAVALSNVTATLAGTPVLVGVNVPEQQRMSVDRIDHSAWNELLKKYVDQYGMVNYAAWKASSADLRALDKYLNHLSTASIAGPVNRNASLAFWINAYNAVTVKGILREYPTTSIRNHTARVFGYNIWKDLKLVVGGQPYSLEQIEHEVLRKMGEPRIHFAIVCASVGCPRLLNEAYAPEKLEQQLANNAETFFANPRNFRYDPMQGTIALSSILDWFGEDFGPNQAEQLTSIAPYLPDAPARQLAESGTARVSYLDYDWNLNDQASRDRVSK
ncbi:MAG: DUF547 domain-containing protein [Pirellulales bacterium]